MSLCYYNFTILSYVLVKLPTIDSKNYMLWKNLTNEICLITILKPMNCHIITLLSIVLCYYQTIQNML